MRDQSKIKTYESDPLRHDKISPLLFLGMKESFNFVLTKSQEIQIPLLMQVSGSDFIVSQEASRSFFESISSTNKKYINYPESYHEIFNDLDQEIVFKDYKSFINEVKNGFKGEL